MAEKTEKPTTRFLKEARRKGKVFFSRDLTTSFLIISFFIAFYFIINTALPELINFFKYSFNAALKEDFTEAFFSYYMKKSFNIIFFLSFSLTSVLFLVAIAINFFQVGALFTLETIKPKLERINPIEGIKKIFSSKTFFEFIKSTLKLLGFSFLFYLIVKKELRLLILSINAPAIKIGHLIYNIVYELLMKVGVFFIFLSIGDYLFQKWQYYKELRMTKEQVKQEYKREEGDPHIKSKRKHLYEEIINMPKLEDVKKADFIVINPKEIAVAIKYDSKIMNAPIVLAKGKSFYARKIKEIARKYNVPIFENKELARALNKLNIGEEVPEELYEEVAQILNFVYHLKKKRASQL